MNPYVAYRSHLRVCVHFGVDLNTLILSTIPGVERIYYTVTGAMGIHSIGPKGCVHPKFLQGPSLRMHY